MWSKLKAYQSSSSQGSSFLPFRTRSLCRSSPPVGSGDPSEECQIWIPDKQGQGRSGREIPVCRKASLVQHATCSPMGWRHLTHAVQIFTLPFIMRPSPCLQPQKVLYPVVCKKRWPSGGISLYSLYQMLNGYKNLELLFHVRSPGSSEDKNCLTLTWKI